MGPFMPVLQSYQSSYQKTDLPHENFTSVSHISFSGGEYFSKILPLAFSKSIPLVATNDVLFSEANDFDIHETKVCINTGKTLNEQVSQLYFKQQV